MKTIPLKAVSIRMAGQPDDAPPLRFTYADTIFGVINAAGAERGMTLAEMAKALRVIGPIQAAVAAGQEEVFLEDADWEYLAGTIKAHRGWRLVHACVQTFVSDIANAATVEPPQPQD